MITLNKLVYDILNITRGGRLSDDEAISTRQVAQWIHNTRATLIRQELNKGKSLSDNIVQSLGCVDVELVDASQCCGVVTDCKSYRTTVKIPKPIEINQEDLITKIGPVAIGERPFQIVPLERIPYMGHTPFKGINNAISAVYDGGYVYIFVPQRNRVITKISIEGVFADPTDLRTFNTCDGDECYTDDSVYPISEHMIETMKQMIINTNLKIIANSPSDNTGNANFEIQPNITK